MDCWGVNPLYAANFWPIAARSAAFGAGVLVYPHGHSTRLEYECSVMKMPVVVAGAGSLSFGPRWSAKSDRTRDWSAAVWGSDTGAGAGYVSEHGDSSGPSTTPHLNEELRFKSTP